MKTLLALVLALPMFAQAYKESYVNRSGNPYVPKTGMVTSTQICADKVNHFFRVYVPKHTVETCRERRMDYTDSKYPKEICIGRKVTTIPAHYEDKSMYTQKDVCVKWNRSDSTRPRCIGYERQTFQLPLTYTQYTYEWSDYRKERPIKVEEKAIENCR
ncbi:hypothetical protein ACES2L_10795 [Bdellovibrio bacteriovorus]